MVNPHLPITETDSYGTIGMQNIVDTKWKYALNAAFPNPSDREDAVAPDLGLQQEELNQLMQHDYKEWNDGNAIPTKGIRSLTLVLCTVQQVLGIEYCPPLPDVGENYQIFHPFCFHAVSPLSFNQTLFVLYHSHNTIDPHARKLCICNNPRDDK